MNHRRDVVYHPSAGVWLFTLWQARKANRAQREQARIEAENAAERRRLEDEQRRIHELKLKHDKPQVYIELVQTRHAEEIEALEARRVADKRRGFRNGFVVSLLVLGTALVLRGSVINSQRPSEQSPTVNSPSLGPPDVVPSAPGASNADLSLTHEMPKGESKRVDTQPADALYRITANADVLDSPGGTVVEHVHAGNMTHIIGIGPGEWLKIRKHSGNEGYIPSSAAEAISEWAGSAPQMNGSP